MDFAFFLRATELAAGGPQLKRFGNFPFHCVGPLVNTKLKRVAHAALGDTAELPVPWDAIDNAIAQSKRVVGRTMSWG